MVAYSFQPMFARDIRSGLKRQTVRRPRKRHAREGERLQLFCGMRTDRCFKIIDDPVCIGVDDVRIDLRGLENYTARRRDGLIEVNGVPLIGAAAEAYARGDGFEPLPAGPGWSATSSLEGMIRFWIGSYGFNLFEGVAIRWEPHRAPTIGGDTPNDAPAFTRIAA